MKTGEFLRSCLASSCEIFSWAAARLTSSGLGAPADVETLTRQVTELQQHILDLRSELAERGEDLAAARAANRELMAQLNR